MIKLHLLTRCTKLSNLRTIRDTIFPSSLDMTWHIIFNTSIVKSFDDVLINELKQLPTKIYYAESNGVDYFDLYDVVDERYKIQISIEEEYDNLPII